MANERLVNGFSNAFNGLAKGLNDLAKKSNDLQKRSNGFALIFVTTFLNVSNRHINGFKKQSSNGLRE